MIPFEHTSAENDTGLYVSGNYGELAGAWPHSLPSIEHNAPADVIIGERVVNTLRTEASRPSGQRAPFVKLDGSTAMYLAKGLSVQAESLQRSAEDRSVSGLFAAQQARRKAELARTLFAAYATADSDTIVMVPVPEQGNRAA